MFFIILEVYHNKGAALRSPCVILFACICAGCCSHVTSLAHNSQTLIVPAGLIDVNGFQHTHPTWPGGGVRHPPPFLPSSPFPAIGRLKAVSQPRQEGSEDLSPLIGRMTTLICDGWSTQGQKLVAGETGQTYCPAAFQPL